MTQRLTRMAHLASLHLLGLTLAWPLAMAAQESVSKPDPAGLPLEIGAIVQGGNGVTDNRDGFHFIMAGVHAGKVLTANHGHGPLRGNFEYAAELFPFWQSSTPRLQRSQCTGSGVDPGSPSNPIRCSPLYTVGGTYTGISATPIILRWNLSGGRRVTPWVQAAGGLLWTNHKYPPYGSTILNLSNDGPNAETSVWNFTPQGGLGLHYYLSPKRSIDFGVNAVHISSASLGDRNPGVNASLQVNLGYTWWR